MRSFLLASALVSAGVTLLVATVPALHFSYRRPVLHVALEEAASLVIVLTAFLVLGRFLHRARLDEFLLACALGLLALATVSAFAAALAGREPRGSVSWIGETVSALSAALMATSALAPQRRLEALVPTRLLLAASAIALAALLVVSLPALGGGWSGMSVHVAGRSTSWPDLQAPRALLALHAIAAAAYGAAAAGFLRRVERSGDEFYAWLAVACVLAASARINYFLFPTRDTAWVYTGDVFRVLFFVVLLLGALREIASYWRSVADAVVLEERRRIARDLHDGLAQELAYIGRNLASLSLLSEDEDGRLSRLGRAVERAQLESRRTLAALSRPVDEPLDRALAHAVTEVAECYEVEIAVDHLAEDVHLSPRQEEGLLRIACEAVRNAAKHSGAPRIGVTLDHEQHSVRLEIRDQGCGFDLGQPTTGFGLVSMDERARAIGGSLCITSAPGRGTSVEVAL